ncbi:techylectin-5B-like [Dreissena polymorpha]|uniref:Fibrinogen C-terminal domain-containing protein n=1 Tax=Dreissena polymorpha TaxID=45954 RepID=A0A9D4EEY0_DREPO|nr:techylectin-5B-like [Dreissena polymorpha]KAH3779364.1 hypothetical protein DPMN_157166 [Dreissena polymorpha]
MDFKNKMLLHMLYLVLFQTVSSQSLRETSTSRIMKRLDKLEDDVLVLKEENDLCKNDISILSDELRNLRKDFDEEIKLRRGGTSNRLTASSGQDVSHYKEQPAIAQRGSCDCDGIVREYKNAMHAFKSEKSVNMMLHKKVDEIRKEHDLEIGNLREMFNNAVSILNSTDRTLRLDMDTIKNETKANMSAAQKLVHDSYSVCQKEINHTRAYFKNGLLQVNESLTDRSLSASQEISRILSDIVNLKTSDQILKTVTDNLTQRIYPHYSCDTAERSGEYTIYPSSHMNGVRVYCYKESTNRGWIVIQRRADGSVNFTRTWADYKSGFGNLSGEFWLGNEHIYQLTKDEPRELRIDMEMFNGTKRYALYSKFSISSESEKYKLRVAEYSGDTVDNLALHNVRSFSTFDADNDVSVFSCCACMYGGGWWYYNCHPVNLNGKYFQRSDKVAWAQGIHWRSLTSFDTSLKFVAMNIR